MEATIRPDCRKLLNPNRAKSRDGHGRGSKASCFGVEAPDSVHVQETAGCMGEPIVQACGEESEWLDAQATTIHGLSEELKIKFAQQSRKKRRQQHLPLEGR